MRKIYITLIIVVAVSVSCKKGTFLDDKTTTALTEENVFTDSTRTMAFLSRMYEEIGFNFYKGRWEGSGTTEQATDDGEYVLANPARRTVALWMGVYNAVNFLHGDMWTVPWNNIRRANLLLSKLPGTPLSENMQKRLAGEAKFMRAYFYTYLLASFGGVPLIGDKVYGINDIIDVPRNSYEECVNYVSKEFDEAAALLPSANTPFGAGGYEDKDYGRVTKEAAMAMKARLLLYAASPLFNGGVISDATADNRALAGYTAYNVNRWQAAADAALAVINAGKYALNVDNATAPGYGFYKVFLKRVNTEYILFVNRSPNRELEQHYNPPSRGGSKNTQPTQQIVDCFPMKNGMLPFNADGTVNVASGYDPNNPYVNRDPRFEYTIIYNGSLYYSTSTNNRAPVFTYLNAGNDAINAGTRTGYYCRKMCDADVSANSSFNTERGWPLLRYAEILLSYAEAINETGQTALAYPKLIELRSRAGINPGAGNLYGLKPNMSVDEMRQVIRNERHIELAYEADSRWDDIRRWKIAEAVNNGYNRAMVITKNSNGTYTYKPDYTMPKDRPHTFVPRMYLFPIPMEEMRKMPSLIQNPGW